MASQTKMIIITSNEDIIRQFSLNKTTNTYIIDLDNDQQGTSDLAFLTELSEINSNRGQVCKRTLESPDHNQSKSVKVSKKSDDLICTICGDRAIGFNYNVISCVSCKSFFCRHAHQNLENMTCVTGQGQCSIARGTRRKCLRCRLDRCFAVGMRKDFILSEEEKQQRRKRLEDNRNITSKRLLSSESTNSLTTPELLLNSEPVSQTFDEMDRLLMDMEKDDENILLHERTNSNAMEGTLLQTLSFQDWMISQSVQSSFLSFFQLSTVHCFEYIDLSDRVSALITWSQFANHALLRFINFFRRINEFEDLYADDRFILIKYNFLSLLPISQVYSYKPTDNFHSYEKSEMGEKHRRFLMLCGGSNDIRESCINSVLSLVQCTEHDPTLLSLLFIILLFSRGLSMNEDEPPLKDSLAVNRAQSYYTKILWNYMVNKQGESKTCKQFSQLLTIIFRIQSLAKRSREFFRVQLMTSNTVDRIAPLIQTVLNIS